MEGARASGGTLGRDGRLEGTRAPGGRMVGRE